MLAKGTNVCVMTASRNPSNEFGLKLHKPVHKPSLTIDMNFKRLDFAKKYEDWTAEQWARCYSQIIASTTVHSAYMACEKVVMEKTL